MTEHSAASTAPLTIQTMLSHPTLKVSDQAQAFYVLVDIKPVKDLPTLRLPLNLTLVLDKSTSMQGRRLQQVKEATRQIINALQPEDTFSLITFSDRAEVLLPAQQSMDKAMAKSIASTIQASGGTEMLQGVMAGIKELQKERTRDSVNHMILLTDGQTYGDEDACRQQAEWAGRNQISFSTMGIGSDWNEDLLDGMANASGGSSTYIDSPQKIVSAFKATVKALSTIVAREVILAFDTPPGITLHEVFQLTPHIRRLDVQNQKMLLGPLGNFNRKSIIMELRAEALTTAMPTLDMLKLAIEGDSPALAPGENDWVVVEGGISESLIEPETIPPVIITAMGKLAIFKMQEKAMDDMASGNIVAATQRLETMATRLLTLGETELARAALLEAGRLSRTGNLSAEGRKRIRYGTRSLSILPKGIDND